MLKSRKELMGAHCGICGQQMVAEQIHAPDCVLRDPGTTHVRLSGERSRVVISGPRDRDGNYWWRSGLSGKVYDIKCCGRGRSWMLYESVTSKILLKDLLLRDIRKYIVDNQGVL